MPASLTYSPAPHAPATAGTQLAPTCGYARYAEIHPVPPLKGLRGTRAAVVSYRASVPAGHGGRGVSPSYRDLAPGVAGTGQRVCVGASGSRPTAHYSLLTANWTFISGFQTFKYGKLGEVTENIRTFALPFENRTYTFKMQYEYDSWNRIQSMTYPDGEVVTYDYNLGGMLEKVYGGVTIDNIAAVDPDPLRNGGMTPTDDPVFTYTYPYIDSIAYNEFELKSEVFHGNGTHTLYFYDNIQRLQLLQSRTRAGEIMQDIIYSYDAVNNITDIANTAGELSNYLGGTNSRHYEYDSLYRLVYSYGRWDNIGKDVHLKDTLRMSYYKNGRISSKSSYANLYTEDNLGPNSPTRISKRSYQYNTQQPNTLASVYDSLANTHQYFSWDRTGNMTEQNPATSQSGLCTYTWTEDNRLQTVADNNWFSYYQYDAGGERTYKLTWAGSTSNRSGDRSIYYTPDEATLYASPYFVVTPQGYTKHYYAESERITSQLGKGQFADVGTPVVSDSLVQVKLQAVTGNVEYPATLTVPSSGTFAYLDTLTNQQNATSTLYFYHPDHLGSSSWITTTNGTVKQHLHYLPWGEDFVNQRSSHFDGVRYTFSAKEKDSETGYSYFGARYYSPDLSIWLSVDPQASKYPSLSPYVYCANNPVKLVDPNGEEAWEPDGKGGWIAQKRDNAWTLHRDAGISFEKAIELMKAQGFVFTDNDQKVKVQVGDRVQVSEPSYNKYDIPYRPPASGRIDYAPINVEDFVFVGKCILSPLTKKLSSKITTMIYKKRVSGYTGHAAERMATRGFSQSDVTKIVVKGERITQPGRYGTIQTLYKYGGNTVIVNDKSRKIITLYGLPKEQGGFLIPFK